MGNTVKNIGGVTKEIVTQLYNNASVIKGIKRQYSDQFAKDGAKIGNVLNVKYLDNAPVNRGRQMVANSLVERTVPITILDVHQYQGSLSYNSADYALSIESFTEKTNLKQVATKMLNEMEMDCLKLVQQFPNQVGTLGTTPGTSGGVGYLMTTAPQIYTNAGATMTSAGCPTDDRSMILSPVASGLSMASLAGLQNPSEAISKQYRKGRMGAETLGFDFIENVNLPTFTTGTRSQAGGTMNGPTLDGATTLNITGLGAGATIPAGEHFTIAGVRLVNPMNQNQQNILQSFAVTDAAVADAGGNATVSISPAISLSNPAQLVGTTMVTRYPGLPINVNGTVDALPLGGATVTFSGAPSTTGTFNVGMHRDAIVMTTVDLPMYEKEEMHQENFQGFSARVWRFAEGKSDERYTRIDSIVVFTMIRKELGCIVWG